MEEINIFISSKMLELREERQALEEFIPTIGGTGIKLVPWIFESDAPASDESIRKTYLDVLEKCELYLGLFWNAYGAYTIDEFDHATEWGIPRHIYVKDVDAHKREDELTDFLNKHGDVEGGITAKWFQTIDELKDAVEKSIAVWIKKRVGRRGAAAATLVRDANNVPERTQADKLYGRDTLRSDIQQALTQTPARVLLQGFGGAGKTALAAEIAHEWLQTHDNALWLRAGASGTDALYEALAQPLGAGQAIAAAQGNAKAAVLRQALSARHISLVVLDDVWNGHALAAVTRALPRETALLVTARQRYPLPQIIPVDELPDDDALALLQHWGQSYAADESAARDLCATLSNLPFALEVAGRTMTADMRPARDLLAQVEKDALTLALPFGFGEAGRENVAALIQTSVDALLETARTVFKAWGAFWQPRITPEMMMYFFVGKPEVSDEMLASLRESVPSVSDVADDELRQFVQQQLLKNTDPTETENALRELQRYGLARREAATFREDGAPLTVAAYRLHDLAYSYTEAQSNPDAQQRALDACLTYTERYNEPALVNFAALVPELDNFMGAAAFAMQSGRYSAAERFAWNLYPVGGSKVLDYLGYYTQARDLLQSAAAAAARQGDAYNQSSHLMHLGLNYADLAQYRQAIDYYEQALALSREIENKTSEGNCLGNLGLAYHNLGEYEKAIDYYQQALTISREIGDKRNEGNWLGNLGSAYKDLGEYEKAIEYHQQALTISREIGDRRGEGADLGNLGLAYHNLGEYEKAIDYHQQALTISREIGDRQGESNRLNNLGVVYEYSEQYDTALRYYQQALAIDEALGLQHRVERRKNNIAIVKHKMTDADAGS